MDKTSPVTNAVDDIVVLSDSSHSQTSIQTIDSTTSSSESTTETSAESTTLTENSPATGNASITSNSSDGSGELSDESCIAGAVVFDGLQDCPPQIQISDDSSGSSQSSEISSSQESSEISSETSQECEVEPLQECQAAADTSQGSSQEVEVCTESPKAAQSCSACSQEPTAGPSREYEPVAGPSHEREDPGNLSDDTQDEFPEITQLNNLFELFERCPLTEEQKDMLYDKLVEGLKLDENRLYELESTYERRKQFIRKFEAARRAAENAPPRDEHEFCCADERPEQAYANVNGIFDDDDDLPLPELEDFSTDEDVDDEAAHPNAMPRPPTTLHPNTRIIIPGPVHGSYDIEVNINTTARAVVRAGRHFEPENPLTIRCVMPLLHFVVNAPQPEPEVDSGNDSADEEEAANFFE